METVATNDTAFSLPTDVIGPILGGLIAGMIGVGLEFLHLWLAGRDGKRAALAPVYDFISKFVENPWPFGQAENDAWRRLPPLDRGKATGRLARALNSLSEALSTMNRAEVGYTNVMYGNPNPEILERLKKAVWNYIPDGSNLQLGRFGGRMGSSRSVETVLTDGGQHIFMHLDDPNAAWDEIKTSPHTRSVGLDGVVSTLESQDPEALQRMFDAVAKHPIAARAHEKVAEVYNARKLTVERAQLALRRIERRWPFGLGMGAGDRP